MDFEPMYLARHGSSQGFHQCWEPSRHTALAPEAAHTASARPPPGLEQAVPLEHGQFLAAKQKLRELAKRSQEPSPATPNLHTCGTDASLQQVFAAGALTEALRCAEARGSSKAGDSRWWVKSGVQVLCPLTLFPVNLLPYPPFKLRVDTRRAGLHRLVDGKFLALQLIATGCRSVCGYNLTPSDIAALDKHVHKCKLGPYRPERAFSLARDASDAEVAPYLRAKAADELAQLSAAALAELVKLRRIQEIRLSQLEPAPAKQSERAHSADASAATRTPDWSNSP